MQSDWGKVRKCTTAFLRISISRLLAHQGSPFASQIFSHSSIIFKTQLAMNVAHAYDCFFHANATPRPIPIAKKPKQNRLPMPRSWSRMRSVQQSQVRSPSSRWFSLPVASMVVSSSVRGYHLSLTSS